ncbi:hypothetical protein FSW04_09890 [Baekduia soli]|uniref:Uncharacterized protein n=1 Tax=Baekduia soli TaxID=496014 RepID=A0A5B8U491_9ACTN|nr:hypothetical protein [Baekduia soli]QEC47850.1 hypothetical protein FSW04_09890 [Baekduia soli]
MNWKIVGGPVPQPEAGDHRRVLYIAERGTARVGVVVELSGTVLACAPESLASPLDEAVRTMGRSLIEERAHEESLPRVLRVSTAGAVAAAA